MPVTKGLNVSSSSNNDHNNNSSSKTFQQEPLWDMIKAIAGPNGSSAQASARATVLLDAICEDPEKVGAMLKIHLSDTGFLSSNFDIPLSSKMSNFLCLAYSSLPTWYPVIFPCESVPR